MAKELVMYYSKVGDVRYTMLTKLNVKSASPDGNTNDPHNSDIDKIEKQMGNTFGGVWLP